MILVTVGFVHYSPKDSEDGIKELILVDNMEQAITYIDKKYLLDNLTEEEEEEEEEAFFSPDEEWWKENEEKRVSAASMGIEIDEYGDCTGNSKAMTLWLESNRWEDVTDY